MIIVIYILSVLLALFLLLSAAKASFADHGGVTVLGVIVLSILAIVPAAGLISGIVLYLTYNQPSFLSKRVL